VQRNFVGWVKSSLIRLDCRAREVFWWTNSRPRSFANGCCATPCWTRTDVAGGEYRQLVSSSCRPRRVAVRMKAVGITRDGASNLPSRLCARKRKRAENAGCSPALQRERLVVRSPWRRRSHSGRRRQPRNGQLVDEVIGHRFGQVRPRRWSTYEAAPPRRARRRPARRSCRRRRGEREAAAQLAPRAGLPRRTRSRPRRPLDRLGGSRRWARPVASTLRRAAICCPLRVESGASLRFELNGRGRESQVVRQTFGWLTALLVSSVPLINRREAEIVSIRLTIPPGRPRRCSR